MSDTILTGATVLTMDPERHCYESGYVWIKDSLVHAVGPAAELGTPPPGAEVRHLSGHLVMPGLINAHGHLSNGVSRGIFDELPLEVWTTGIMWRALEHIDAEIAEASAALALHELMCMGVTTTANSEFSWPHLDWSDGVLRAVQRGGARVLFSRMTKDNPDPTRPAFFVPEHMRETPEVAVSEVQRLRDEWNGELVEVCPEAVGPLWCTEEMVKAMHQCALDNGTSLLMHMNDSQDERDEARRRFGAGSVSQMEVWGCLEASCLFAHCTWLDDEEVAILREHDAGVSHNPVANASYACGLMRLPDLLDAGVRVGLGVDGASTNNGQNLWETAKVALLLQKNHLEDAGFGSAELALELLTIGGARALHMEDRVGSLESGKQADVIVIDLDRPSLQPRQTAVSNLVYSHDPGAVASVFVAGKERVRGGVHLTLERGAVIEEAQRQGERKMREAGFDRIVRDRMHSRWRWHEA